MTRSRFDVWQKNFALALQDGVDIERGCTAGQAVSLLHGYFTRLISGKRKPSQDDTKIFYVVKNAALAILAAKLRQDTNKSLVMAYDIGVAKNHDYGMDNIPKYGVIGITVRLNDKFMRVQNLMKGVHPEVRDEKLRGTLIDIVNYATYAIMLYKGMWQ